MCHKSWYHRKLFLLTFSSSGLFNTVDSKQTFNKDFVDDWIQTIDLWFQNQPLCQLSHNHWPPVCIRVLFIYYLNIKIIS